MKEISKNVKNNGIMYIPIDKDLGENMIYCCQESGVEMEDVVDYSLRFILSNYIDRRNEKYAKMTPKEIIDIYPEMDEEIATAVIKLAKDNSLAIIKPVDSDEQGPKLMEGVTSVVGEDMCNTCKRLMEQQDKFDNTVHSKYYIDNSCKDNNEYITLPTVCNDNSPEVILPTLGELIDKAHHVNVNIQIVMNQDDN